MRQLYNEYHAGLNNGTISPTARSTAPKSPGHAVIPMNAKSSGLPYIC